MATMLGFGQPLGGVMQAAFVVKGICASIARFQRDCGAGLFCLPDHFPRPDQFYSGAEAKADVTIPMGFSGHMQIEPVQPLDNHPSAYHETFGQRSDGFHHFGIACADVEAALRNWNGADPIRPFI